MVHELVRYMKSEDTEEIVIIIIIIIVVVVIIIIIVNFLSPLSRVYTII